MRVLALAPYPYEAASTRFRLGQLVPALAAKGIDVTVRPFIDGPTFRVLNPPSARGRAALGLARGAARRLADLVRARKADVVLVLREAVIAGPPVVEVLASAIGRCPLVLDLDDATWVPYRSPPHGHLGTALKSPRKALTLIDLAAAVTCGSRHVAEFVAARGGLAVLLAPAVDLGLFRPRPSAAAGAGVPVVGWVGSHSTFPYLRAVLPALAAVAGRYAFHLRVVGAGSPQPVPAGLDVEWRDWSLAREAEDFASLDVGLYPLPAGDAWAEGKAGLKAVQYMASGVPFVMSPVGSATELGMPGTTHLLAEKDGWEAALDRLLDSAGLRARMGAAGREHAVAHHSAEAAAETMAEALRAARS